MEFRYDAVKSLQAEGGKTLVAFAAPAADIAIWGGIPQKKRFDEGEESAGFQREDKPKRVQELATFLRDPRNTLQNPLLCSERTAEDCEVRFEPLGEGRSLGQIVITMPDLADLPMTELLGRVQKYLETRVPDLADRQAPEGLVSRLQLRARAEGLVLEGEDDPASAHDDSIDLDVHDDPDVNAEAEEESADAGASAVLFEESHISDFWEEIAARLVVLKKIDADYSGPSFLGFSREALESYIRPVVVMDGQHRLLGALASADAHLAQNEALKNAAEERVEAGESAKDVTQDQLRAVSRRLPISLLMDPNPAEHVFQFVVVNQKATPIGRALLGTIVSTSLSDDELQDVAERLDAAGIPLDESRAASLMARREPFIGRVDLGVGSANRNDLLQWAVMVTLVKMFRDLEGGVPYHQQKNDYARSWSRDFLETSPIVANFREAGFETPKAYWRSMEGPWRKVFVTFWETVRETFANVNEPTAWNYWGRPRTSNLFNKPSLHILASDFFRYLYTRDVVIESPDQVADLCKKWLSKVDSDYFNRDWRLQAAGVKKDSTGIRFAWSKIWDDYISNPQRLPDVRNFSKPSMV